MLLVLGHKSHAVAIFLYTVAWGDMVHISCDLQTGSDTDVSSVEIPGQLKDGEADVKFAEYAVAQRYL